MTNTVSNAVTHMTSARRVTNAAHATPRHEAGSSTLGRSRSGSAFLDDPSSRAPRHTAPRSFPPVFLRLVSETLRRERFETYADLVDAVKTAAARARIRYTSAMVWDAVATVDQQRGGLLAVPRSITRVSRKPDSGSISRDDAARILRRLESRELPVQVSSWQ